MVETYVSIDVETNGPIPGPNSMLSLGAAVFQSASTTPSGVFEANLQTLPGSAPDPETVKWWGERPDAWKACRENPYEPQEAMRSFYAWYSALPGKKLFVAYPTGFDYTFVYWYLRKFVPQVTHPLPVLDIRSFAMAALRRSYLQTSKKYLPKELLGEAPHTHKAVEDAIEQGQMFIKILRYCGGIQ